VVFNHDLIIYIDLTMSQLQTQQLMTSQIRPNIEYLIRTYNILLLIITLKIDEKCSRTGGFQYDLMMIIDSGLLFWATLYIFIRHEATTEHQKSTS